MKRSTRGGPSRRSGPGLGVKRRDVEDHDAPFAGSQLPHLLPVPDDGQDLGALNPVRLVASVVDAEFFFSPSNILRSSSCASPFQEVRALSFCLSSSA